jgi:hypothetical protein
MKTAPAKLTARASNLNRASQPANAGRPPDHPPQREIPAVVTLIRERLDNLHGTAMLLRERLGPALTPTPPTGSLSSSTPRATQIGGDLESAIDTSIAVANVLSDILDRLEI